MICFVAEDLRWAGLAARGSVEGFTPPPFLVQRLATRIRPSKQAPKGNSSPQPQTRVQERSQWIAEHECQSPCSQDLTLSQSPVHSQRGELW